jgi:hypothetical protein
VNPRIGDEFIENWRSIQEELEMNSRIGDEFKSWR